MISHPRGRGRWLTLVLVYATLLSCGGGGPGEAVYQFEQCGQRFVAVLRSAPSIQRAEELLSTGEGAVVGGTLARGDGGFNAPWSWHMTPETTTIADAAIEVCDGCPDMVEGDMDYWFNNVGSYCPWGARVVSRLR